MVRTPSGKGRQNAAGPARRRRARPAPVVLWGRRTVAAALANPERAITAIWHTPAGAAALAGLLADLPAGRRASLPEPAACVLGDRLPQGAAHQGVAVEVRPLPERPLGALLEANAGRGDLVLVILDQVTDPRNVGAVLRSAAAFGAAGVIVQKRHSPPADGALAKAASGALERVPLVPVTNIARTLDLLRSHGIWRLGFAGGGPVTLQEASLDGRTALVLGAEGTGLRRLTREHCDQLVRIPTEPDFGSLNVATAASIALHEVRRAVRA